MLLKLGTDWSGGTEDRVFSSSSGHPGSPSSRQNEKRSEVFFLFFRLSKLFQSL